MRLLILIGLLQGFAIASIGESLRLRVTTWSLKEVSPDPTLGASAEAGALESITSVVRSLKPDILLLQNVRNRGACEALVRALEPESYHVVVCSDFGRGGDRFPTEQTAIVARYPAVTSWSVPWRSSRASEPTGGYVGGLISFPNHWVTAYSVEFKDNSVRGDFERANQLNILQREMAAAQLVEHVLDGQADGRIGESVVVGGNFNTDPSHVRYSREQTFSVLERGGFLNGLLLMPAGNSITVRATGSDEAALFDYLFVRQLDFAGSLEVLPTQASNHFPVTATLLVPESPPPGVTPHVVVAPEEEGEAKATEPVEPTLVTDPGPDEMDEVLVSSTPAIIELPGDDIETGAETETPVDSNGLGQLTSDHVEPELDAAEGALPILSWFGSEENVWRAGLLGGLTVIMLYQVWQLGFLRRMGGGSSYSTAVATRRHAARSFDGAGNVELLEDDTDRFDDSGIGPEDRARRIVRSGLLPHLAKLMTTKLVKGLLWQRSELLDTQAAAEQQVRAMEGRMAQLQSQVQARMRLYEDRIAQLERELAEKDRLFQELQHGEVGSSARTHQQSIEV